jgi:hypothetical protein
MAVLYQVIVLVDDDTINETMDGLFLCFLAFWTETRWAHAFWGAVIVKIMKGGIRGQNVNFLCMEILSPKFLGSLSMTCPTHPF